MTEQIVNTLTSLLSGSQGVTGRHTPTPVRLFDRDDFLRTSRCHFTFSPLGQVKTYARYWEIYAYSSGQDGIITLELQHPPQWYRPYLAEYIQQFRGSVHEHGHTWIARLNVPATSFGLELLQGLTSILHRRGAPGAARSCAIRAAHSLDLLSKALEKSKA